MADRCNLCSSNSFAVVKHELRDRTEKRKVYRCLSCGHIQVLPRPDANDDREFYNANLQDKSREKTIDYETLSANSRYDTDRHLELFRALGIGTDRTVLDIGAGYGFFVSALHKRGYLRVTGHEISSERRAIAAQHSPASFIDANLASSDHAMGKFDVITLFHVLEHMVDPIGFLRCIPRILNTGGMFICEVPNVNELLLDACKEYNDFYWIRAHLNYFSSSTLLDCLKKAGFADVSITFEQRYGLINLCNWLSTGKPQIDRPVFEIDDHYKDIESFYRQHLVSTGKSDAIIAIGRV